MRAEVAERVRVEKELRHALERDELVLVYQPMVGVCRRLAGGVRGADPLAAPRARPLAARDVHPLAEENGLIVPIGDWVLREACHQAAAWRRQGRPDHGSGQRLALQLAQPGFVDTVRGAAPTPACRRALWLELVEASIVAAPRARCTDAGAGSAPSACASPSTTSARARRR